MVCVQLCYCGACKKEKKKLAADLQLAKQNKAPAADIQSLTERMDDIHYMFMSYDPRVIKWYWEKMPWVGEMFPAYLTHKAGISKPLLWMLLRGPFQGQQPHDLASQVVEFHNLQQTGNVLQFYGFQRACRSFNTLPRMANGSAALPVKELSPSISILSAKYLQHILHDYYFSIEPYILQWMEQHCCMDICAADHHGKRAYRVTVNGKRMQYWVYKVMNSWGGFPISVICASTSYDDPSLRRAHKMYEIVRAELKHPEVEYVVCDNPWFDGRGLLANCMPGLGLPILHVLHDITVVGDDEMLCNTACTRLRNRAQELADSQDVPWDAPLLFWDTESVAYIDGSGVSQQHCSLVQVMAAPDTIVLFRVCEWPADAFNSFKALWSLDVPKIAHCAHHDIKHLSARFPGMHIQNPVDTAVAMPWLKESGRKYSLECLVSRWLRLCLDKRVDHRLWSMPVLSSENIHYAAADVMALFLLRKNNGHLPPHSDDNAVDDDESDNLPQPSRAAHNTVLDAVLDDVVPGEDGGEDSDDEEGPDLSPTSLDPVDLGADAAPASAGALTASVFNESARKIRAFAGDQRASAPLKLQLTAGLSVEDRYKLHQLCYDLGVAHWSIGPSNQRVIVISRWQPWCVANQTEAHEVVGGLVARYASDAEGPVCGFVEDYKGAQGWQLRYEDAALDELVQLDVLNERLKTQHEQDVAAGNVDAAQAADTAAQVRSDASDKAECDRLVAGVIKNWDSYKARKLPHYDIRCAPIHHRHRCPTSPSQNQHCACYLLSCIVCLQTCVRMCCVDVVYVHMAGIGWQISRRFWQWGKALLCSSSLWCSCPTLSSQSCRASTSACGLFSRRGACPTRTSRNCVLPSGASTACTCVNRRRT